MRQPKSARRHAPAIATMEGITGEDVEMPALIADYVP
ncbi:hypothetical protein AB7M49_005789 [Bradyrhizobium elkanii]|jgi:hypothetical protein|uniref:Uncharacterized protein n=1 Tax=Bradyrhizobium elkanii TaxID=29448 RepID=A0A8I1YB83_BRAEL|nr:hypothetical protein [Bradyrhizobium elkanii]MCS4003263.1 hypothetical protein [Bradyrhizobium elkanii USDA 61]MCP1933481.1 hypothetical protein [Bradyrhizobium elkanii]MCP1968090.1 hypothetical protein [Bradyrhizobium elkanii]MCS3478510.1 hypothetical protein [Bradyrhizobium elkanii]